MTFIETASVAIHAILVNKTRSFLTMLGVIIGVGAVILLVAIGEGLQQYITGQFDQLGANTITILPGDIFSSSSGFGGREEQVSAFSNNKLRLSDVVAIEKLRSSVLRATPVMFNSTEIVFQGVHKKVSVVGTTDAYVNIRNLEFDKGAFFTPQDNLGKRKVVVLGASIADELFKHIDPIGKRILVNGQGFTVAGVVKKIGGGFGGPQFDRYVYIPLETYRTLFNVEAVTQIVVQARNKDTVQTAITHIKDTLGKRLKKDEFSVFETTEILKVINQILGVLTVGLGGIAAISLVVGGIGIMNIMLVSVTERTREIGLRKAVGATPNQILLQFLIESALLSVVGGSIGVALAFLLSLAIRQFFPATVTLFAVTLAFSVSAAIGIIFGVAPARRASKLSPIEALRYE